MSINIINFTKIASFIVIIVASFFMFEPTFAQEQVKLTYYNDAPEVKVEPSAEYENKILRKRLKRELIKNHGRRIFNHCYEKLNCLSKPSYAQNRCMVNTRYCIKDLEEKDWSKLSENEKEVINSNRLKCNEKDGYRYNGGECKSYDQICREDFSAGHEYKKINEEGKIICGCKDGYDRSSSGDCVKEKNPREKCNEKEGFKYDDGECKTYEEICAENRNSHYDPVKGGCVCDSGYRREGPWCVEKEDKTKREDCGEGYAPSLDNTRCVKIPPNAHVVNSATDVWSCNEGYKEVGGKCKKEKVDLDSDGLSNSKERELGTDPTVWDTDGDGYYDGQEIRLGQDPLSKNSGVSDKNDNEDCPQHSSYDSFYDKCECNDGYKKEGERCVEKSNISADEPTENIFECGSNASFNIKEGCTCDDGYVKNTQNKCVRKEVKTNEDQGFFGQISSTLNSILSFSFLFN